MNGQDISAILELGACAAQMGTEPLLAAPEPLADDTYQAAISNMAAQKDDNSCYLRSPRACFKIAFY